MNCNTDNFWFSFELYENDVLHDLEFVHYSWTLMEINSDGFYYDMTDTVFKNN